MITLTELLQDKVEGKIRGATGSGARVNAMPESPNASREEGVHSWSLTVCGTLADVDKARGYLVGSVGLVCHDRDGFDPAEKDYVVDYYDVRIRVAVDVEIVNPLDTVIVRETP